MTRPLEGKLPSETQLFLTDFSQVCLCFMFLRRFRNLRSVRKRCCLCSGMAHFDSTPCRRRAAPCGALTSLYLVFRDPGEMLGLPPHLDFQFPSSSELSGMETAPLHLRVLVNEQSQQLPGLATSQQSSQRPRGSVRPAGPVVTPGQPLRGLCASPRNYRDGLQCYMGAVRRFWTQPFHLKLKAKRQSLHEMEEEGDVTVPTAELTDRSTWQDSSSWAGCAAKGGGFNLYKLVPVNGRESEVSAQTLSFSGCLSRSSKMIQGRK